MKLPIILLSIILLLITRSSAMTSYAEAESYTMIPSAGALEDPELRKFIDFGLEEALLKGSRDQKILQSTDFSLTKLNQIFKENGDQELPTYRFDVLLQSPKGQLLNAYFTVGTDPQSNLPTLKSYLLDFDEAPNKVNSYHEDALIQLGTGQDYVTITSAELKTNTDIQAALTFGAQQVVAAALQDGKISTTSFTVDSTSLMQKKSGSAGTYYKFTSILNGGSSGATITTTFTVYSKTKDLSKTLASYSYSVKITTTTTVAKAITPDDNAWTFVDIRTAQSTTLTMTLQSYAINQLLLQAASDGKIKDTTVFSLKTATSYETQTVSSYQFYRFTLVLTDGANTDIQCSVVVAYAPSTAKQQIYTYSYKVITTTTTTTQKVITIPTDGYTLVSSSDVASSADIQSMLQYGIQQIISIGLTDKKIPINVFKLTATNSVYKKAVGANTFYVFDIVLENGLGTTVSATFAILYISATATTTLMTYNYNVVTVSLANVVIQPVDANYVDVTSTATSDSLISAALQYGINQVIQAAVKAGDVTNNQFSLSSITFAKTQTVRYFNFYSFSVNLLNPNDDNDNVVNIYALFTVNLNTITNLQGLYTYSYTVQSKVNVNIVVQPPDDSTYSLVDPTLAQSSIEIQFALQNGVQSIVQQANTDGKISDNTYTVSKVNSVYKSSVRRWNFYKFDIQLSNGFDTTIAATFLISYDTKVGTTSLRTYSYSVTVKTVITQTVTVDATNDDGYVTLSSSDFQTDLAQNALNFAVKSLLQVISTQGGDVGAGTVVSLLEISGVSKTLDITGLVLDSVTLARRKTVSYWTFYSFEFTLTNNQGTTVTARVIVGHNTKASSLNLLKYAYTYSITTDATYQEVRNDDQDTDADNSLSGYTNIDVSTLTTTNSNYLQILQNGLQPVIDNINAKGVTQYTTFTITEISSASYKTTDTYTHVIFSLKLDNGYGTGATVKIHLKYNLATQAITIKSYSYVVTVVTITAKYKTVTSKVSGNIPKFRQTGIDEIIKRTTTDKLVPPGTWPIIKVDESTYRGEIEFDFRFTVKVQNSDNVVLTITYTVHWVPKTDVITLTSFSIIESYIEVDTNLCLDAPDQTEPYVNKLLIGRFDYVFVSDAQADADISASFNTGLQAAVQQLASSQSFADSTYTVTSLNSVYKQFVLEETLRFNADVAFASGTNIKITFGVGTNADTNQDQLLGFNYRIV